MPINNCELPPSGYIALDPEKYPGINNRGNLTTVQLVLLAAAEEAYSAAAGVLQPALKLHMRKFDETGSRLQTGLHLLEEAMAAHNRYMDGLK